MSVRLSYQTQDPEIVRENFRKIKAQLDFPSGAAWGGITGTLSAQEDLQDALNLKLDASAYNDHFKGKYTTLSALQTAFPTANAGDYAQVDPGSGSDVINYNYDVEDGWIEGGSGSGAINTDQLPEGTTNLYFTVARVLAVVLTGLSTATGGDIVSTDTILAAFGKIQKRFNDLLTNFNGANQLVKLDGSATPKLPAVDGSLLVNLPSSGGGVADNYAIASGTNTYTASISGITAYSEGMSIRIKFTNANTGASTININFLGSKNIYRGALAALTAGVITADQIFELYYDGTQFQLGGSSQVLPTTPSKVVTTDAGGLVQAIYDTIDINSTTTETTLLAADWSTNIANVTGVAGTEVHGTDYLFYCTGTNTWRRVPWSLSVLDLYLTPIDDTAGRKTASQMNAAYPAVIKGQRVRGATGVYEFFGATFGWGYYSFTII